MKEPDLPEVYLNSYFLYEKGKIINDYKKDIEQAYKDSSYVTQIIESYHGLLEQFNFKLNDIDAIFVTHEHIDHTKGLDVISSKYNLPVFASKGTWNVLNGKDNKISQENKKIIIPNKSFEFGDLRIYPFSTPHDAADPLRI